MASINLAGRLGQGLRVLVAAVMAVLISIAGGEAMAVVPTPVGFTLDISPNARLLDALDLKNDGMINASTYYGVQYDESCDNPHLRILARNMPSIMILNDSTSAAPITTLTLNINAGAYAFGTGDVAANNFTAFIKNTMYTDPGVTITGSSVSADQKKLTVNFDGLVGGKMAIFGIDLDSTDANAFPNPDYRMVLFGAPLPGESKTTPATATATFTNPGQAPNSRDLSIQFVPQGTNPFNSTPAYFNEDIRPYHVTDKMEVTHLGGVVPEPSAALLALAGLAMLGVRSRQAR